MQTIYILWLRQLKRWYRSKSRIVGALAQPLLYLLSLGYGLGHVFSAAGQGNYIQFLVPGIIGMSIIFTAMFSGMEIIWDRQFGFLKETLVAPVSRTNIMLGRTLGGASVAALQGFLVFVIAILIGFRPDNWLLVVPALLIIVLISILFTSLGIAVASRISDMQGFQLIMNFLIMPLFFLSGALFPLRGLPTVLSWFVHIDPLAYGIDALRHLLIAAGQINLGIDLAVLAGLSVVFLALGSYFFSKVQI